MAQVDVVEVPETHVLAIASHVTSGYVGNTMATFCMQTLGCEVSAIHTVNYSNHVGYQTFQGRKTPPEEVAALYSGLQSARLDNFDMLLSGYCPSAALVNELGKIGRDAKFRSTTKPGSFFWVLDPVMGDNGRIYVAEDTPPAYKRLLKDADLILPNQFEAELLADVKIQDVGGMARAIGKLHKEFGVPHVVVTSINLADSATTTPSETGSAEKKEAQLTVIGSTATTASKPRLFRIGVPALPVFFSGTGDMFAALLVPRLRQAAEAAGVMSSPSWRSSDDVEAMDLPLAKAVAKVLASMHAVLKDTAEHYAGVAKALDAEKAHALNEGAGEEGDKAREMEKHLRLTRAAEVRVVRNAKHLREPPELERFQAKAVVVDDAWYEKGEAAESDVADELGVLKVSGGEGAVHQT